MSALDGVYPFSSKPTLVNPLRPVNSKIIKARLGTLGRRGKVAKRHEGKRARSDHGPPVAATCRRAERLSLNAFIFRRALLEADLGPSWRAKADGRAASHQPK